MRRVFIQAQAPGKTIAILLLISFALAQPATARAAELLDFEFKRSKQRYEVTSSAYIDVPPAGVYAVLTDYENLHRISRLVVESADLGHDEQGQHLVYTHNKGCLALFCRSLKKTERLQAEPVTWITTEAISAHSDVAFSHSEWRLQKEGRGTRLDYHLRTDINFWVPPVIGNLVLSRWLKKGAASALNRIEYFAWQHLYGDDQSDNAEDAADDEAKKAADTATIRQEKKDQ